LFDKDDVGLYQQILLHSPYNVSPGYINISVVLALLSFFHFHTRFSVGRIAGGGI